MKAHDLVYALCKHQISLALSDLNAVDPNSEKTPSEESIQELINILTQNSLIRVGWDYLIILQQGGPREHEGPGGQGGQEGPGEQGESSLGGHEGHGGQGGHEGPREPEGPRGPVWQIKNAGNPDINTLDIEVSEGVWLYISSNELHLFLWFTDMDIIQESIKNAEDYNHTFSWIGTINTDFNTVELRNISTEQ